MGNVTSKKIIVAEYFVNEEDIQGKRETIHTVEQIKSQASDLIESCKKFRIPLVILTNVESDIDIPFLKIMKQDIPEQFSEMTIYFKRWIMAYSFLQKNPEIEEIFFVDATDVEVLNYPFRKLEAHKLYFGDEIADLDSNIIFGNENPKIINDFFKNNIHLQVLNPGVIGGKRGIVVDFLSIFMNIMTQSLVNKKTSKDNGIGNLEMALMNYVAYNYFGNQVVHGRKVSTKFYYYIKNGQSWFRHK